MNLALSCDVRFAARSARFDTRFLRLGLHPGGGHVWSMNRIVGRQGVAAMTLFGEPVDGPRAEQIGLAWRCCEDEQLLANAREFAKHVVSAPRALVVRITRTLREVESVPNADTALEAELAPQLWSLGQDSFRPRVVR
jgi:enoyl-CoA hydratase